MNRKFLSLAPLLVIAAFAVMPAVSQAAAPRFFKNNVEIAPGCNGDEQGGSCGIDFIAWGTLTLGNANIGTVQCENTFAGDISNPEAITSPGTDNVDAFSVYDCASPACEALGKVIEIVPLGLGEGKEWPSVLTGEGASIRDKVSGIKFLVKCPGAIELESHGELSPKVTNGSGIGSSPSKVKFDATSGELESGAGPDSVSGTLKIMGYEGQEIIAAK